MSFRGSNFLIILVVFSSWLFAYLGQDSSLTDDFSNALRSDGLGYYSWTQFFMGEDNLCFTKLRSEIEIYSPLNSWVIKPIENSPCYLPVYPIGLGILLIPFYVVAAWISQAFFNITFDPYSIPFQVIVSMSGAIFVSLGLIVFIRMIQKTVIPNFAVPSTLIALFVLTGSNLLHYATYDGIFSHASSFMINAAIVYLYLVQTRETDSRPMHYLLLGFLPILGSTIRLTNFTFILFLFLVLFQLIKKRQHREIRFLALGFIIGLSLLLYQLYIWKLSTGDFFYFTYYSYEGFSLQPEMIPKILFSFNPHGLLPWSPILLLSLLGSFKANRFSKPFFWVSFLIFAINTIIFSSWSQPFGGGAFGNRLFVDLFPLLFLSIAFAYSIKNRIIKIFVYVYSVGCSIITLHFTYRYWIGQIDFGGMPIDDYMMEISILRQNLVISIMEILMT